MSLWGQKNDCVNIYSCEYLYSFWPQLCWTHYGSDCKQWLDLIQYIPRNMHTVFALLCFVVVIHWLIFPYPPDLLHWHCGNLTIAPVPAKQPWWKLINTSCEFIMNDCITTTKQSTTKPCAYFLGYTVVLGHCHIAFHHAIFEWTFNDHLSFHKWNKMYSLGVNVMPVQTNR